MRFLLLIGFFCILIQSRASTYYISSSSGLDNRSVLQAQNINTPWKTITKVNTIKFQPGDSILFKRGDTFFGSLDMNESGTLNNPIVFAGYGTGEKPIISGFTTVPNWTNTGGNIYGYFDPSFPPNVNMVVVDGAFQPIGRYPKANAKNGGWLTNQSHIGHSSITSNEIGNLPSFTGGQIVMRKYQWLFDVGRITSQTSTTVTLDQYVATGHPSFYYDIMDGHGFFFQNHVNTLTQTKEWCYDSAAKKVEMHSPGSSVVKVSTIENLVNLNATTYINFDNISFTGANSYAFNITRGSSNISITNCDISYSGINAIHVTLWSTNNITVDGCKISYTNNNAIEGHSTKNWLIQNNTIANTGMVSGMGLTGDGQYNAISYTGDESLIQNNRVINTGYIGIHFTGSNTTIKNNYFDSFVMIKSDGGAIYTYGETTKTNRVVTGNIILNGIGTLHGANEDTTNPYGGQVHGIYMDGGSANVTITNNTVSNSSHSGIWLSSPKGIVVTGNTLYNNTVAQIKLEENVDKITSVVIKNNIFFATDTSKLAAAYNLKFSSWPLPQGIIDSNYYERPLFEPENINTQGYPQVFTYYNYPAGGVINCPAHLFKSFDLWKTFSGHDANSNKSPISVNSLSKIRFEYNVSNVSKTISLNGYYVDSRNKVYNNSYTLAPYSSIILISIPTPTLSPIAWNGSTSNDWNTAANWNGNKVPTNESTVIIPSSAPIMPFISSVSPTVNSIIIKKGAALSIDKGTSLSITGALENYSNIIGEGEVILNGSSNQAITGVGVISNLKIHNSAGAQIQANSKVDITGVLKLASGLFTTANALTLKSSVAGIARIAPVEMGTIAGNVTVEHYITSKGSGNYRLLAPTVTTTTSIKSNWQEGINNKTTSINNDPAPGCGIHITGSTTGSNGFDATSAGQASLFTFSQPGNTINWPSINNTDVNSLDATKGYLVFVRGNRSVNLNSNSSANNTILRASGTLTIGDVNFKQLNGNGKNNLITNPYASPVTWKALYAANSSSFENYYTCWDPNIGSKGGYVTVDATGTASIKNSAATTEIQSGEAFIVKAKSGVSSPSFFVKESDKIIPDNRIPKLSNNSTSKFYVSLYSKDAANQRTLQDGVLARFADSYSSSVDGDDASDTPNFDENISLKRDGELLSIESRSLKTTSDTLFINVENLNQQSYEWQLDLSNMEAGRKGFLRDKFTGVETPVSLSETTSVSFSVTADAASSNPDRFSIVFKASETLPVKMLFVDAYEKTNSINVIWKTTEEVNIEKYEIEKSTNGRTYLVAGTVKAKHGSNTNYYDWLDNNINSGYNYYKIKTVDLNGHAEYSNIVRVQIGLKPSIKIASNPITGGQLEVQLINLVKGNYNVRVFNLSGQVIYTKSLNDVVGTTAFSTSINSSPAGLYQLEVTGETGVFRRSFIKQ